VGTKVKSFFENAKKRGKISDIELGSYILVFLPHPYPNHFFIVYLTPTPLPGERG
jgi:hypothetical protein